MSGKVMGQVYELDLPHHKQSILLALTDHADHEGGSIRPSMGRVAWKTGYSERQVRRIVKSLVADGLLIVVSSEVGKTTEFRVNLEAGTKKPPYQPIHPGQNVRPDEMSPRTQLCPTTPDILTPDPGHPGVRRTKNRQESSEEEREITETDPKANTPHARTTASLTMTPAITTRRVSQPIDVPAEIRNQPAPARNGREHKNAESRKQEYLHPALAVYGQVWGKRYLHDMADTPRQRIMAEVGDDSESLAKWREINEQASLEGWKPSGVKNTLDVYHNGRRANGNGSASPSANGHKSRRDMTAAERINDGML